MRSLLLPFLWLLVSFTAIAAQRTCRILFLGTPDNVPVSLQLFDGTSSQEVALPRMNFSDVYTLPPGAITLRLLENAPEKPGRHPGRLTQRIHPRERNRFLPSRFRRSKQRSTARLHADH